MSWFTDLFKKKKVVRGEDEGRAANGSYLSQIPAQKKKVSEYTRGYEGSDSPVIVDAYPMNQALMNNQNNLFDYSGGGSGFDGGGASGCYESSSSIDSGNSYDSSSSTDSSCSSD